MYMYTFRQKHNNCFLYKLLYILYYSIQTTTCFGLYRPSSGCREPDIVITQHNGDDAPQDWNSVYLLVLLTRNCHDALS
jgi:hypothetical protein